MNNRYKAGFTLVETLVAVVIFATIGILSTRVIMLSVQGSKKGSSSVTVRENLNYSLSVIERLLRNANDIVEPCVGNTIDYYDQEGILTSFSCSSDYIASGSARLTSTEVTLTTCSITCNMSMIPPSVTVILTGEDVAAGSTKEGAKVTISSTINLRTY